MKKLFKMSMALLAVLLVAVAVAQVTGINFKAAFAGVLILSFLARTPDGVALAGINQEIWTDVLVRNLKAGENASFINEIPDRSDLVIASRGDNDIIHLVDVGADPEVLINNNTYPIPVVSQNDGDIPIQLDKYQTEATAITEDEIQYIAYDKIALVQEKHLKAIKKTKFGKSAHALAPQSDTSVTPVISTTGPNDGTGRKKMTFKDLISLKRRFDSAGFDDEGRILVLSTDHYNDLFDDPEIKNLFKGQFSDEQSGKLNMFLAGFKVYSYLRNPYFNATSKTKLSYGAIPGAGDYRATFAFVASDVFRATGRTKQYTEEPKPRFQRWLYNVRHNFITLPKKQRSIGAIISATV